jgi:hypothetical protein
VVLVFIVWFVRSSVPQEEEVTFGKGDGKDAAATTSDEDAFSLNSQQSTINWPRKCAAAYGFR